MSEWKEIWYEPYEDTGFVKGKRHDECRICGSPQGPYTLTKSGQPHSLGLCRGWCPSISLSKEWRYVTQIVCWECAGTERRHQFRYRVDIKTGELYSGSEPDAVTWTV